ncbi:glycosyltransferase family 9 protein [Helicobacter labetoulli]|uniref:glycosyltransferase family 9 protein n=1 Tax=Helicobacter labetoulli TaxID=2315333 RepID=UPI001FC96E9C|nr:glycosyltransferase family 9 protein [Helicobacter labetoulli]
MRIIHLVSQDDGGAGRACIRLHKILPKACASFVIQTLCLNCTRIQLCSIFHKLFQNHTKIINQSLIETYGTMLKLILRSVLSPIIELSIKILTFTPKRICTPQSLVILRTDAIGDYLLFRAFLSEVRKAYPNYHITLIGNSAWKPLYEYFDSSYCDNCIWINTAHFQTKHIYKKITILRQIKQIGYELLINPVHSRDKLNTTLASHINALNKIAPQGDDVNLSPRKKTRHDRIYTTLTPSTKDIIFEFYRNKEFFEYVLQKPLETSPKLHLHYPPTRAIPTKKPYSVLFIGASAKYRQWSIEHFAEVGAYLMQNYKHNILICGGSADRESGAKLTQILQPIAKGCGQSLCNLAGKTTLVDLAFLVYNGNLLVSNETSVVHLCALLDTTIIVVVSNGNHLGRFIPYPKEIRDKYYPVLHPFITANYARYKELSNAFAYKSTLDINDIQPKQVIDVIEQIYTKEQQ